MSKPTEENVGKACDLIKAHFRAYGNAATESRLASLVYSIHALTTGDGKPAADHDNAIEAARQARKTATAPKAPEPAPKASKPPEMPPSKQSKPTAKAQPAPDAAEATKDKK